MKRADAWWPTDLDLCRVCGWSHGEPGWVGPDVGPRYLVCECCGAETGVDDITEKAARAYRAEWLDRGTPWWDGVPPHDWSALRQLERAGIRVRHADLPH